MLSSCQKSNEVTILFNVSGGEFVPDMKIAIGDSYTLPTPTKPGYSFLGWYIDDETFTTLFTEKYDLSQIKDGKVFVVARWVYITYTITFETNGGTPIEPLTFGDLTYALDVPDNPTKEHYIFAGWYKDESLIVSFNFATERMNGGTLYAKWTPIVYTMTFDTNGGSTVNPISRTVEQSSIIRPNDPTKEGFTFSGWYLDSELTELYTFDLPINNNVTLYAKWEEEMSDQSHVLTDELPIYSGYYGNTNGNINNMGYVVYDSVRDLHYFSRGSYIYAYDPETDETSNLLTMTSGGRATYLNLNDDVLYFIDSSNGYLISYDLTAKTFKTLSETENIYLSTTQSWVSFLYNTVMYEQDYVAFQRYLISSDSLSSIQGYGYEQMNISGTRVYYKPIDALSLYVMSYNGIGKSTVVNLATYDVTDIFESLLYHVDYDYNPFYALILEKGSETALYLYNPTDGLVKIMDTTSGNTHSLNYNGEYLYVINDGGLYEIDLETKTYELLHTVASDAKIQIINYWIYFGTTELYRINPETHEIESALAQ
jgi:uncharacterized repeat protein (TIGR02543 family)